jgi:hypothetical protein
VRDRAQGRVDHDQAPRVGGDAGLGGQRGHRDAGGPQRQVARNHLSASQFHRVGQHLDDPVADLPDDAQAVQRLVQVGAGLVAHHRAGFAGADQGDGQSRVLLGDLGGGFDAGEAAAAHRDGAAVRGDLLQLLGERARPARIVQRPGVIGGAGHERGVGAAAQGVDQLVVGQRRGAVDVDALGRGVDGRDPALDEVDARTLEDLGDVVVGQLLPGGDLVHAQPLLEAPRRVHQGDLHVELAGAASEADRGQHAGVAGAEDDDPARGGAHEGGSLRCFGW